MDGCAHCTRHQGAKVRVGCIRIESGLAATTGQHSIRHASGTAGSMGVW